MSVKLKLKISDDKAIRYKIEELYYIASHKELVKWSMALVKNILDRVEIDQDTLEIVYLALDTVKLWENDLASVYDVRQASLKIHRLAKACDDLIVQSGLRSIGHAIACVHMSEHVMVASDYAIKTVGLLTNNSDSEITKTRLWQLDQLRNILNK